MESILTSIKKLLGISEEDTNFDIDITVGINTALAILTQLGVGPPGGFSIQDSSATWTDFVGQGFSFDAIKSYVHLKAKLLFDPPVSSALIDSTNRLLGELEWRIMTQGENAVNSATAS